MSENRRILESRIAGVKVSVRDTSGAYRGIDAQRPHPGHQERR
jgi:hypothetical protein